MVSEPEEITKAWEAVEAVCCTPSNDPRYSDHWYCSCASEAFPWEGIARAMPDCANACPDVLARAGLDASTARAKRIDRRAYVEMDRRSQTRETQAA